MPDAGAAAATAMASPIPRPPESGALRFARFAFRPNALGYCGGEEPGELFERVVESADDPDLHRLCGEFAGARPYLELLAEAPGAKGPLDPRVVEAYWVGGPLLDDIRPRALGDHVERRFRRRMTAGDWRWLADKPAAGAVPHHAFHVLEIYPRVGLLGEGSRDALVPIMGSCLVRPAQVVARHGDTLLAMARPLEMIDGRLCLGEARPERILARIGGRGFVEAAQPGDWIAVHWGWACDVLRAGRRAALEGATDAAIALAAQTT